MKSFQTLILAFGAFLFSDAAAPTTAPAAPATQAIASPSDTLRAFTEATKKKDAAAIKQTLSKGSLELLDKTAQAQNTTADELLKRGNAEMLNEAPEISNERIENDTATVDVRVKDSPADTIPLVKENGAWKIAFDKYQQQTMEKMRQEMNNLESNSSNSVGGEAQTVPPGGKPKTDK